MNDTFEKLLNEIILEISFKSDDGMIEFNESNRDIVKKYLKEYLDDVEINEMLTKLSEAYKVKKKDGSGSAYNVSDYDPSKHILVKTDKPKPKEKPKETPKSKEKPKEKIITPIPINPDLKYIDNYQTQLENDRSKGIAGAGGPVASEGESKFCNACNTDIQKWSIKNKNAISEELKNVKNNKPSKSDKLASIALGLDINSDEFKIFLAKRNVWAKQKLEEIKKDKDSVFYKSGKQGFGASDEAYIAWMYAAFGGAVSTKRNLEKSNLDTTKNYKVVQSTSEFDDGIELQLEEKFNSSKGKDKKYYETQLKLFKLFRGYHDTYVVGFDKNGRITIVSISNKKDDEIKDPQNNTTPAQRLKTIMNNFVGAISKQVLSTMQEGVEKVSNAQANTVKLQAKMKITDEIVKVCDSPKMKKYMLMLDDKGNGKKPHAFSKWVMSQKKDWNKLSTQEKLILSQKYTNETIDNYIKSGKKLSDLKNLGSIGLPYEPFGKLAIKLGEFKASDEVIEIKKSESDIITAVHTEVVNDIYSADIKAGNKYYHPIKNPKADNGPNAQAYISSVLSAVHVQTYINLDDEFDNNFLIQSGIQGIKASMIRNCLGELSGYGKIPPKSKEGLSEHLTKKCRVQPGGTKISIMNNDKSIELFDDTWRTAGTSQKVASGFGTGMRNCLIKKVANDAK